MKQTTFVFALAIVATFAMSLPNLIDPLIRHDDYPAFFADAETFWPKTLNEGRWVNYLWHLRGAITPAWLNFAIYQLFWAVLAASIAVLTFKNTEKVWPPAALAVLILASPSAALMSVWFNTLFPALALVTIFAVLACFVSERRLRFLFPLFVIPTFMAYTTYPLILFAVCLLRSSRRSVKDLFILTSLFAVSFVTAVILTYSINWYVHGVFGVPLDEWRSATPAHSLGGLAANLPKLWEVIGHLANGWAFGIPILAVMHLGFFAVALTIMLRKDKLEALYLSVGLFMGLSLVVVQVLKLGVIVPPRAYIFAWVFYAIFIVRAAQMVSVHEGLVPRFSRGTALFMASLFLFTGLKQATIYRDWQSMTRAIGAELTHVTSPIYVTGKPMNSAAGKAAFIQTDQAFLYRMQQVTGRDVILCPSDQLKVQGCDGFEVQAQLTDPSLKWKLRILEDGLGTVVAFQ